ncbi:EAL domain-containing protein [Yoonia sediminilitoris]|uniref:EAL domain-containing protein (Putative c-di-GMP-specific phosphodiesterase class I) n=1 Tax=Yoonia sediminilitoris TaxID=1286148 RepID=A0A2T6KI87_9RHOB|nr:EAL domain-containing protein [Yoonia sediminilitoris]PUB15433.1 EAL domain-containing protein (putative c-di-GMP-specific phosphodiesterase class I) [Yoonia sediminilitoris]RCW96043.1 EAL domain-containing protein (putative c-di-GMP-specific phosphodiesterase class I) [Yoonia sediminilitoris]
MGIVNKIDDIILGKSARFLNDLCDKGGIFVPELSVNVSQERLCDPALLASVSNVTGPFALSFELLESIAFDEENNRFEWMLDARKERGVGIQIDDFGSGRASISALLSITPERLKIDRHLIMPIVEKESNRQLMRGIVGIARSMKIKVTAEGIETMEHAAIARDLGCDRLQGYAFAKPLCEDDFRAYCQSSDTILTGKLA